MENRSIDYEGGEYKGLKLFVRKARMVETTREILAQTVGNTEVGNK